MRSMTPWGLRPACLIDGCELFPQTLVSQLQHQSKMVLVMHGLFTVIVFSPETGSFTSLIENLDSSVMPRQGECVSFGETYDSIYRVIEVVLSYDESTPSTLYVKIVEDLENEIYSKHQTMYPNLVSD